jgi:hypothetical protein
MLENYGGQDAEWLIIFIDRWPPKGPAALDWPLMESAR